MTLASFEVPFWHPDAISIGPVDLHPFGILVAIGVVLGAHLMRVWGEKRGLEDRHIQGLVWYCVGFGFVGAHVFDVLAYQPGKLAEDPLLIVKLWQGISSYGGFIGGVLGFVIYVKKHDLPVGRYADASIVAFVPGFTFGRMGCSVAHDHIGAATDGFFLATNYPIEAIHKYGWNIQPGLHHNLGFYELLFMLVLCAILFVISRWKNRPDGFMAALMGTLYAPVRFVMEFFRVNPEADPRYVGLTFAQWMSIILFLVGVVVLARMVKNRNVTAVVAAADEAEKIDEAGSDKPKTGKSGSGKSRSGKSGQNKRKKK
jgi:phosphatidylglycerol:prolipoprotein diacylglycerol transferase